MGNELIIRFTDQSQSFANGVEFGRLLQKMEQGDECIQNMGFPVQCSNKNVLIQACNQYGYIPIFSQPILDEWVNFIGVKKTTSDN